MSVPVLPPAVADHLQVLFTRFHVSAAAYVAISEPYTEAEDAPSRACVERVETMDGAHALLVAKLLHLHDRVPEASVFPYWFRDLNYLSMPYMADFVADTLDADLRTLDETLAATPDDRRTVRTALTTIRTEREALRAELRPLAEAASLREGQRYAEASAGVRAVREAREARAKAEAAAAKAQAAEAAKAAKAAKAAAAPAAPAAAADVSALPDPDEEGISGKEKAKRTMMIRRAQKKAAAAAPAAAPTAAPDASALPDPDEPGISAKEKAKRTMMIRRAQKKATE